MQFGADAGDGDGPQCATGVRFAGTGATRLKMVSATIARMSQACAQRFRCFADAVRDLVAGVPVKHMEV